MENAVVDLVELSHYAAQHPRLVQGAGGNCSVKFSDRLVIKASGYLLEEVSEQEGYVVLDLKTDRPIEGSALKASLETHLHKLLSKYVIHTHPIVVLALVSAWQGKQVFQDLFPEGFYQWVDYAPPGDFLAHRVSETLRKPPFSFQQHQALFLGNHGLLVTSPSKERCIQFHEETVQRLENFFGGDPVEKTCISTGCYLTPDHVVYGHLEKEAVAPKQRESIHEVQEAVEQALGLIHRKHWTPRWLEAKDIDYLLQMSGEKYRQDLWKHLR